MDAPSTSNSSAQQSPSVQMVPQPAPTQGSNPSTAPFLQDFTLIAEAAKRAQMAIMIRDFEDCGLTSTTSYAVLRVSKKLAAG
ncbi:hypothetical protein EDB82DRAFT_519502 [Fusarium venenatum]|nr:hypothetical protein EDB82DRAFT_519502 [Fusarium venenatum]